MAPLSDFDRALLHLQSAYRTEMDALQVEAYRRGLMDYQGDIVRAAVDLAIKDEKFFPSIATLREYAIVAIQDRRTRNLAIGPAPEPVWAMSDEDHAELMRQMAEAKARIFAKEMKA